MLLTPNMGEWTILERLLEAAVQQHSTMIGSIKSASEAIPLHKCASFQLLHNPSFPSFLSLSFSIKHWKSSSSTGIVILAAGSLSNSEKE
ncbi:hypothetical protein NQZ68_037218 [Dissostichus eleginoides]|nr:hypothetical protein NQZ68_037218 [Dissostichus eleginoides]